MLTAKLIRLAANNAVPVLSYFCHLPRRDPLRPGNPTREAQALIALTYALLRQAIALLPPAFETTMGVDLSERRFGALDGTVRTWGVAVGVLGEVLALVPRVVVCVVDGVQWLDDASTRELLRGFVGALAAQERVKVLFTTAGRSACLRGELAAAETVDLGCLDLRGGVAEVGRGGFGA